jgi:hypothetical protein
MRHLFVQLNVSRLFQKYLDGGTGEHCRALFTTREHALVFPDPFRQFRVRVELEILNNGSIVLRICVR